MQNIIFDMDDTLIIEEASATNAFLETCRQAEESCGIQPDKLHTTVRQTARELWHKSPARQFCLDVGISSWEGLHGRFEGDSPNLKIMRAWAPGYRLNAWYNALMKFGIADTELAAQLADAYVKNRQNYHILYDDAEPCLDELSKLYRLTLLTNGAPDIQRDKINSTGIGRYFTDIIISGEVGYGKPDPQIYNLALSQLGATPENTWIIGNSLESDIAGAIAADMKTAWLNRNGVPRDESIIPDLESPDLYQFTATFKQLFPLNQ